VDGAQLPVIGADSVLRRGVDVVAAVTGLIVAGPLLVVLAAAVRLTSRGPALFRQSRVGRDEVPFTIVKLRTMHVGRADVLVSGSGDSRITKIGQWLRRTRLDELPQLVNLLRGELTLIGPRPEVERFVKHYTADERAMLRVRPGIIGPGAVLFASGQSKELNDAEDPEAFYVTHHLHPRLELDLDYLAHRTVRRDLSLVRQAVGVCARRG
jgi:lipopolysaccharide/colanic/teichoic acid biosynthesis glycosyltransferase